MRSPLSSPSHNLFWFYSSVRTPNADRRKGFYFGAPFGRRSHASKTHPHHQARLAIFRGPRLFVSVSETTNCHASGLAASKVGGSRRFGPGLRAMPATDFYTCRLTSLPNADSRPKHHNLYSPTGDPPKPGTGRPFCHAAAFRQARVRFGRPDQSSTRRYRRFTCFALPVLLLLCAKLCCLGKRSRLCRRATDEEYPGRRRTKGARRRRQPSPAPSFALTP